jgi:hypothetical protein
MFVSVVSYVWNHHDCNWYWNHWNSVDKKKNLKDIKLAIEIQIRAGSTRYWVGGLFFWIWMGACGFLPRSDIYMLGAGFGRWLFFSEPAWDLFIWSSER